MSKVHWLALTQIAGIGGTTARRLLERFGSVEAVFEATIEDLDAVSRVSERMARAIKEAPLGHLEAELLSLDDEDIGVLTWDDEEYPANLRAATDAPPLLFLRGAVVSEDELAVAIVGTRQAGAEGLEIAETLGKELAARGLTVVSGLALGIDSAAHRGALAAGGRTLAVLGSGLRIVHPRSNADLAECIAAQGAVLSELHPSAPPRGQHLMARDRITSGLSRTVIVVEAGERSGSLDTAARARKQGRLVFAVDIGSEGTSRLLREGAERLPTQDINFNALAARIVAHAVIRAESSPPPQQMSLL
ncbi:MAG: DNA-protecting protein DprA [Chloroflexi bacterium]|nr:DNA-protecting protein DprA [Chloroflexota bacterium]